MMGVVGGLVPIAAAIALGWVVRRTGLVQADLWTGINKLAYLVLLPALLFVTIGQADLAGGAAIPFLTAAVLGFLGIAALSWAMLPILRTDGPSFSSVFQGGVRWNGFVILALAQVSLSTEQAALVAIVFGPTVPLINILCVMALSVWGEHEGSVSVSRVLSRIVTNPLIIGCFAGMAATVLPWLQPPLVVDTAELIGRAALPLILLAIGAGLDFSAIGARPRLLAVSVGIKLMAAPALFILIGSLFGLPSSILVVLAAVGGAPGAASAYVLAKELGGNAELMAGHVTVTTLLAFLTLPFWMWVAGAG